MLGAGKTFVYQREGQEGVFEFEHLQLITEAGVQYLLLSRYDQDTKYDSIKLLLNNKTAETFYYMRNDPRDYNEEYTQGEIKEDKVIDDGTKLGTCIYNVAYSGKRYYLAIDATEKYLKDTSIEWQGKPLDCVVVKLKSKISMSVRLMPLLRQSRDQGGEIYYAKGIGMILFNNRVADSVSSWKLVDIRD